MKVRMEFADDEDENGEVESDYDVVEFSTPNGGSCEAWADAVRMFVKPANYSWDQILLAAVFRDGGEWLPRSAWQRIAKSLSDKRAKDLAEALASRKPGPESEATTDGQ